MGNSITTLHSPSNSPGGKYFTIVKSKNDSGWSVHTENGAAGKTPKTIPRTQSPVSEAEADEIIAALLKKKTSGSSTYEEVPTTADYDSLTDQANSSPVSEPFTAPLYAVNNPEEYIEDDAYWMQKKHDGERRYISSLKGDLTSYGRYGQPKPVPTKTANTLARATADFDCEIVDKDLYIFDMTSLAGMDISSLPFKSRYQSLSKIYKDALSTNPTIHLVPVFTSRKDKSAYLERLREQGSEGAVFRHRESVYKRALTATKRSRVFKYKFYYSASVIVSSVTNGKRSVGISVLDSGTPVPIGKVTIPSNSSVPSVESIIDVRYRHWNLGGALVEPCFERLRDDVRRQDCTIAQLKSKG